MQIDQRLLNILPDLGLMWRILCVLGLGIGALILALTLVKLIRRKTNDIYFLFMAAILVLWSITMVLPAFGLVDPNDTVSAFLRESSILFLPSFLCLHTWTLVSYKRITVPIHIIVFIEPVVLFAIEFVGAFVPEMAALITDAQQVYFGFGWYAGCFLLIGKSYLLCLNVFYQMPRHMRKTTWFLIAGITMIAVFLFAPNIIGAYYGNLVQALLALLILPVLYDAISITSSNEVIVTSREYVFGSVSTLVLVLNENEKILDWNKRGAFGHKYLPRPKFRESLESYRARLIQERDGKVSHKYSNILSLTMGNTELHFLFTTHEVRNGGHLFGYITEIFEVTGLYSTLRYFEEIAMRDQLTSLYSRNAYMEMVHSFMVESAMPLGVVVGDVNRLKLINDTHGHIVGDSLLKSISGVIDIHLPEHADAFRIGGDEFVILVPETDSEVLERLITNINEDLAIINDGKFGTPEVSWGYAIMTSPGEDYNEVFKQADAMMYATKKARHVFRSAGLLPEERNPKEVAQDE